MVSDDDSVSGSSPSVTGGVVGNVRSQGHLLVCSHSTEVQEISSIPVKMVDLAVYCALVRVFVGTAGVHEACSGGSPMPVCEEGRHVGLSQQLIGSGTLLQGVSGGHSQDY